MSIISFLCFSVDIRIGFIIGLREIVFCLDGVFFYFIKVSVGIV